MPNPCCSRLRRAAVFAAALLAAGAAMAQVAAASCKAAATGTSAVSSTEWGAVLAPTSVATVPSCPSSQYCASYSFTLASSSTYDYFDAWGTGSAAIVGLSYEGTWTGGGEIDLTACSVAWTQTGSGTCSGTKTTVFTNVASGTYQAVTAAGTYPAAPGARIYLQAKEGSTHPPANTSVSMSTSVCSGGSSCTDGTTARQIRAAATTNA